MRWRFWIQPSTSDTRLKDASSALGVVEEPVAQECEVVVFAERRLEDFEAAHAHLGCRLPELEQPHVIPMFLDAPPPGMKLGSA